MLPTASLIVKHRSNFTTTTTSFPSEYGRIYESGINRMPDFSFVLSYPCRSDVLLPGLGDCRAKGKILFTWLIEDDHCGIVLKYIYAYTVVLI